MDSGDGMERLNHELLRIDRRPVPEKDRAAEDTGRSMSFRMVLF
jgi:hypothetical protein